MSLKQRLNIMFAGLPNKMENEKQIDVFREGLKRSDRIVWFLRHYKRLEIEKIPKSQRSRNLSQWVTQYDKHYPKGVKESQAALDDFEAHKHFADLAGTGFNTFTDTYVYEWQNSQAILTSLEQLEARAVTREEDKERSEIARGTLILDCDNDLCWRDLGVSHCPEHAKQMNHCGNGNGSSGVTIYVLFRKVGRDSDGHELVCPFVTFIYNKHNGSVGEMKGRFNQKPTPDLHPAIVDLLIKTDHVNKLVGGGYLPENNFALSDLSPELLDSVYAVRRDLFSYPEKLIKEGITDATIADFPEVLNGGNNSVIGCSQTKHDLNINFQDPFEFAWAMANDQDLHHVVEHCQFADGSSDQIASLSDAPDNHWVLNHKQAKSMIRQLVKIERAKLGGSQQLPIDEIMADLELICRFDRVKDVINQATRRGLIEGSRPLVGLTIKEYLQGSKGSQIIDNISVGKELNINVSIPTKTLIRSIYYPNGGKTPLPLKEIPLNLILDTLKLRNDSSFKIPKKGYQGWALDAALKSLNDSLPALRGDELNAPKHQKYNDPLLAPA